MEYQVVMTDHSLNEKNSDRVATDLHFLIGSTCALSERPEVETSFSITLKYSAFTRIARISFLLRYKFTVQNCYQQTAYGNLCCSSEGFK